MIEECEGYKKLLAAVEHDEQKNARNHDYRGKLAWIVDRAKHYAEKTGLTAEEILDAWESRRNYWYMNYYQDCDQPEINGDNVVVFETKDDLLNSIGKAGFRCPYCNGVSTSPYECNSGVKVQLINSDVTDSVCNWKAYGLFGHMGKGVYVFVKHECTGENMFKPVAWEDCEAPIA